MKRWLVLVGGGGCGRWQAGALTALHEAGLLNGLAGIVGTSVGGLNACVLGMSLASGKGASALKDAWDAIQKDEDIYHPSLAPAIDHPWAHPIDVAELTHGFLFGPGAVNTDALKAIVDKILGGWTTDKIFAAGGPQVFVRALCYRSQRADTLCGDLAMMAMATSAIEGIFPKRYGYGDGGAVDNEPVDVALNEGADQVLVVYCGPENREPGKRTPTALVDGQEDKGSPSTGLQNAIAVLSGITAANEDLVDQAASRAEAQGVEIIHCFPKEATGSALDFTERGLWARGVADAEIAIAEAKAKAWA